jgi:hypothetical protein
MQTGIVCMDPETHWKRGMFEGKNFSNENRELLEIKHKIESYDTRFSLCCAFVLYISSSVRWLRHTL